jgi:hypothetical protein
MECVVIGVWFLCGIVGAIICDEKGRSAFGGLLVGLLFGPIGIIICAVLSRDDTALEQRALRSGQMRKCPHCAEPIRPEAKVCRYCGRDVSAPPADQVPHSDGSPHLYTCPNCGAAYDLLKTQACPQCRTRCPGPGHNAPPPEHPPRALIGVATPDELLARAIAAIKAGRKSEGRDALRRLVRKDKENEKAWLWLSDTADTPKERAECLRRALSINPNNPYAQIGLRALAVRHPPPAKMSRGRWIVLAALGAAALLVLTCLAYLSIKTFHTQPPLGSSSTQLAGSEPSMEPAPTPVPTAHLNESDRTYVVCLRRMQPDITRLFDEIGATYALASDVPDSANLCGRQAEWADMASQIQAEHEACPIPSGQIGQMIRDATESQLAQMAEAIYCWSVQCDNANARWRDDWLEQGQAHLDQAAADSATALGLVDQFRTTPP